MLLFLSFVFFVGFVPPPQSKIGAGSLHVQDQAATKTTFPKRVPSKPTADVDADADADGPTKIQIGRAAAATSSKRDLGLLPENVARTCFEHL